MNVLHRDMAAKNVMIDRSGDVYLIDFGVVRYEDTLQNGASSASIIKGTLNYLAPEHAAGEPCPASDVFGLHAILWEMLEGRMFRTGFGERQLWAEVMQGNVPPLTRGNVPTFLRTLIEWGPSPRPRRTHQALRCPHPPRGALQATKHRPQGPVCPSLRVPRPALRLNDRRRRLRGHQRAVQDHGRCEGDPQTSRPTKTRRRRHSAGSETRSVL